MSKENLTSAIRLKEEAVQKEKQPDVEQSKRDDIVDESQVNARVAKIEDKLAKSALSDEYKDKIKKSLDGLMQKREGEIKSVSAKAEAKFREVFAKTIKDLEEFDSQPGVKEIYEVLEPFFANKEKIKPVINLVEYKRNSGNWKKINDDIQQASGIGPDKIVAMQGLLNVKTDGHVGPDTINALSKMMDLGISVRFGRKTLYEGETKPGANVAAETQAKAKVLPKLDEANEAKLAKLSADLDAKTQNYLSNLMANGQSRDGHEGDKDVYREAFQNVVNGMEGVVGKQGAVKVMLLMVDPKVHGGIKAVEGRIAIPATKAEYEAVKAKIAANFLQERRGDYMTTGDPRYKEAFDKSQQNMTGALKEDVNAGIAQAGGADGKIEGSTVDPGLKQSVEGDVNAEANKIIDEFDALQRLQADDPMKAYHAGVKFHEKMKAFKAEKAGDHRIDFATLRKLPNLRKAFFKVVDTIEEQATYVVVQAVSQNREVVKYRENFMAFNSRVGHLLKCINKVFEDLRKGKDEPSELVMKSIHDDARDVLGSPLLKSLRNPKIREFAALKYFQGEDNFERKVNLGLMDVKDVFVGVRGRGNEDHVGSEEFIKAVESMCYQVQGIEGSAATWNTFLKNTGKELVIVTAAVAGAVAMGALVAASGGIAGAGLLVAAGNLGITAVATGLGAAIGSEYTRAAIDNKWDNITTESMMKAWGTGAAYTAMGMGVGAVFGTALGRGAAAVAGKSGGTMAKAAVYVEQYGAKMAQQAVRAGAVEGSGLRAAVRHYLKEVAGETREEFVENALEQIGKGVAPNHPWLGFALSMIPSSTHHAKAGFVKGINTRIAGNNLSLTYTNQSDARALMISKGVPAEAIAKFDRTGEISTNVGNLNVEVKPERIHVSADSKVEDVLKMKPEEAMMVYDQAGDVAFAKNLLGLQDGFTTADLKKAHRQMAVKYHPDKHGGSEVATVMFQALRRANVALQVVASDVTVEVKTEEKTEEKPVKMLGEIRDVKLRQKVENFVNDLWSKVKDANHLDGLNKTWASMKNSVKKASKNVYARIVQRLSDLAKNLKQWGGAKIAALKTGRDARVESRKERRRAKAEEKIKSEDVRAKESQDSLKFRERRINLEGKEYSEVQRETEVMYIPDIHGDVQALKNSMRNLGLIDASEKWIGGSKVVQFAGDYIDRGHSNLATLDYLGKIAREAQDAGGRVDMLMGNHEALMIGAILGNEETAGIWLANGGSEVLLEVVAKYGSEMDGHDMIAFKDQLYELSQSGGNEAFGQAAMLMNDYAPQFQTVLSELRKDCFEAGGRYYDLIRSWKPVSQVDDVLYVHAGVSPKWSGMIRDLGVDGVNARWQQALADAQNGDFTMFNEFNEIGASRLGDAEYGGLFWIDFQREVETMPEADVQMVAENLKSRGINAVVVGHTKLDNPRLAAVFERHGIKIVASDVGMSEGYRGEEGSGKGGVRIDTAGNIVAESNEASHKLHEVQDIKHPKTSENILAEYFKRSNQPQLSKTLVEDGLFQIENTVEIAGVKYNLGPVYAHGDKYYSVMMVDKGNGVLLPRVLYYSTSQGAWRSTRGFNGRVYDKGVLNGGYAQETLLIPELATHLNNNINRGNIGSIDLDIVERYFSVFDANVRAIDTYGDEGIRAFDAPELAPFLQAGYQPGKFNSFNTTDYFRSLDGQFPKDFVPDFTEAPVAVREGSHIVLGKTFFETYETQYRGNRLQWEMGRTADGKVWVERVSFADSPVTSYGTSEVNLLSGLITSKPLEYNDQVTGLNTGRDVEYVDFGNTNYVDVTPLIDNLLPIRQYRSDRGIQRTEAEGWRGRAAK